MLSGHCRKPDNITNLQNLLLSYASKLISILIETDRLCLRQRAAVSLTDTFIVQSLELKCLLHDQKAHSLLETALNVLRRSKSEKYTGNQAPTKPVPLEPLEDSVNLEGMCAGCVTQDTCNASQSGDFRRYLSCQLEGNVDHVRHEPI